MAVGSTITLTQTSGFPCRIAFRETGVELRANETNVPDVGQRAARDSRGRYYTNNGQAEITVWSPQGRFLRNIGRLGKGPGEFAKGGMSIFVGPHDTLYVRDNNLRWSVFGPDYTFIRQTGASHMAYREGNLQFLTGGKMLSGDVGAMNPGKPVPQAFVIYDFSGPGGQANPPISRSFGGPAIAGTPTGPPFSVPNKLITPVVANEFWSGPPENQGRGYELQLWSLDGTLQRTVRREVPWFPKGADVEATSTRGEGGWPKPTTQIVILHSDGKGLVYVVVRTTNDKTDAVMAALRANTKLIEDDAFMATALDVWMEIIDVNSGTVLASDGPKPATALMQEGIMGFFGPTFTGYRRAETPDGTPSIRIVELQLLAKSQR